MRKYAVVCRFKRTAESPTETGVAIANEGSQSVIAIVGVNGKPVTEVVWRHTCVWILGCFRLPEDEMF